MIAETVYLFRHALLRDAAYQLQLPGDRGRLHELAFASIEALAGGRAPEPGPLEAAKQGPYQPHATDAFAEELAGHARFAEGRAGEHSAAMRGARKLYLRRAARHLERNFHHESAVRVWREHAELVTGVAKGESLRRAGAAAESSGRADVAEQAFRQAIAEFRSAGHRRLEGVALGNLAVLYRETGRIPLSEECLQEALGILRETGDRSAEGAVLGNLAGLYQYSGHIEQAERTYAQALAAIREAGDRRSEGQALGSLAELYAQTGRVELAERTHIDACLALREIGDRRAEGIAEGNLAGLHWQTGRLAEAEQGYTRALAINREVGNRRSVGIVLGNRAGLYRESGQPGLAEQTYLEALSIHRELGNRRSEGIDLGNLADLYREIGRLDQAERSYREALAIHRETNNRRFEGAHLCGFGLLLLARALVSEARETWRQGASILRELGDTGALQTMETSMKQSCARAGVPPFEMPSPRPAMLIATPPAVSGRSSPKSSRAPGGTMRQFDLHAGAYDAIRRKIVYPEELFRRLSSACGNHDAALDIGCGNGVSTVRLAPYFRHVEGVDLGENLIAIARANHPGIPFRVSPAEELSADRRFDLVTCATAFYWMDRDVVLRRCADVLVAGGVFCAYRYDFPAVDGPARKVIENELATHWARHRDPRLVAADDTLERIVRSGRYVEAERFVVPNVLDLTPEELALFFLSTSYVTRFQDAEAVPGYAADFTRRVCAADRGAAVRVNFDIHGFQARTPGGAPA